LENYIIMMMMWSSVGLGKISREYETQPQTVYVIMS